MNINRKLAVFAGGNSPNMVLLDLQGRKNPVSSPDRSVEAIKAAIALHGVGGTGRTICLVPHDLGAGDDSGDVILLFYRSHSGRPKKAEIARVAKEIAKSTIRGVDDGQMKKPLFVTGSRAVVYAERIVGEADTAVFMCSKTVWYNYNRSIICWPSTKTQIDVFLKDINDRLPEGSVSVVR